METPYVIYNATLQRPLFYSALRLQTAKSARWALHHVTQREKSCLVLFDTSNWQVLAVRVSKQSKHHFPRNYFKKYSAYIYFSTGDLVVFDFNTGEVVESFAIKDL